MPATAFAACPVCGHYVEILSTKKQKPYWICHECGVQVFVRSPRGIVLLQQALSNRADRRYVLK